MQNKITFRIILFIVIGVLLGTLAYKARHSSYISEYEDMNEIYAIMNKQDSKIEFIAEGFKKEFDDNDKEQFIKAFQAIDWNETDVIEFGEIPAERIRINGKYWLVFYDEKVELQPSKKVFTATEDEFNTLESIIRIYRNDMFISDETLPQEFFNDYFKDESVLIEVDSEKYGYKRITKEESDEFRELIKYDGWEQIYTYENELVNMVNMREKGNENISSITILDNYLVHIGRTDCYFKIPMEQYDRILAFVEKIYSDD